MDPIQEAMLNDSVPRTEDTSDTRFTGPEDVGRSLWVALAVVFVVIVSATVAGFICGHYL